MFESLRESLKAWNESANDRIKLQHAYFTIFIILLIVAGLIGLVNIEIGKSVLVFSVFAGLIFVVNAISWALLQSFVVNRVGEPQTVATTREATATKIAKKRTAKK